MELVIGMLLCVAAMATLWAWQLRFGRADWVDVAWAVAIGVLVLFYAAVGEGSLEKRILVVLITGTWSFRLARHLWARMGGQVGEDGRYQTLRAHWGERQQAWLLALFLGQAVVAWLFSLPGWVVANDPSPELNAWVFLGVAFWLVGLIGESAADRQLEAFRKNSNNRGKVCDTGLWRYSRHPNYFFEWLHWFAYPFIAIGAPYQWVAWLAPVIMLLFLWRLTGIPHAEKQALKSRGGAYRQYQRGTSAFFPLPRFARTVSPGAADRRSESDDSRTYSEVTVEDPNPVKRWLQRRRLADALRVSGLAGETRELALLDYGAGDGELAGRLRDYRVSRIAAYEPIPWQMAELRQRLSDRPDVVLLESLEDAEPASFDYVFCLEVLEHLTRQESERVLARIRGLLKPHGRAVIGVPLEIHLPALVKGAFRMLRRYGEFDARIANVLRAVVGRPPPERPVEELIPGYHYHLHHLGFDHRELEGRLKRHFTVERRAFSPFPRFGSFFNSEIYLVVRPKPG